MGDSETEPRVIANTDTETMDFVECFDGDNDAAAARRRHTDNTETAEAAPAPPKPIIPTPLEVEQPDPTKAHQVQITSDWKVVYDDERLRNEAVFIASKMRHVATVMVAAGRIAKIDPSCAPLSDTWFSLPYTFCFLAALDPRVGHTIDVLSPFISVLCHSG